MLDGVTIRRSTKEDVSGVRDALDSVARERKFLAMLEAPTLESVEGFVTQPNVVQVVAVEGDLVVGWADVQRMDSVGFEHRGFLGMGIVSTHRRRGLGNRLLTEVTTLARNFGVARLELEVFLSNQAAVSLYQRHGFRLEGQLTRGRIIDGIVDDILVMSRWIGEEP